MHTALSIKLCVKFLRIDDTISSNVKWRHFSSACWVRLMWPPSFILSYSNKSVGGAEIKGKKTQRIFLLGVYILSCIGREKEKFEHILSSCEPVVYLPSSRVCSHDTVGLHNIIRSLSSYIVTLQRISVIKLKSTIRIKVCPIWGELIDVGACIRNFNAF